MVVVVVVVAAVVVVVVQRGEAVPSKVGNRMVPSWWIGARTKRTCQRWSDCAEKECCVRPMLASRSYCFPYKTLGESCDASALLVNMEKEVFLDHCPCDLHLTCANLYLGTTGKSSHSVCVDPDAAFDHGNTLAEEAGARQPDRAPSPVQITF
ncbi:hypothetical protein O3P69_014603 [Scylla paramamosain]|uniref:Prokineticin domain-containing protein n=1 Tax=Scylla paramamosain TaxID=85552 RepID=A0AAW0TXU5_SCYPA